MPLPPIETIHLFPGERRELISLLRSLTPQEWMLPTPCAGWSVHDVAIHVLGDDIGKISGSRDSHPNPEFATGINITSFAGLVAAIDRQNDQWVKASRRISPALVIELLGFTGSVFINHVRTLDLDEIRGSVDWAGPEPAPVWMDLAREYTERWHHQQHSRSSWEAGHDGAQMASACFRDFYPWIESISVNYPLHSRNYADAFY